MLCKVRFRQNADFVIPEQFRAPPVDAPLPSPNNFAPTHADALDAPRKIPRLAPNLGVLFVANP